MFKNQELLPSFILKTREGIHRGMHAEVYVAKVEEWKVRKQLFHISINRVSSVRSRDVFIFFHHKIPHMLKVPALEKLV